MYTQSKETQSKLTPETALNILKKGNDRFVKNLSLHRNLLEQKNVTSEGQFPFAAILSCMDSRTSAELVFDQGLGDLFVIRVAGNIVAPSQIGSIEYAAEVTGARLVVVMGHSNCGAIQATIDQLQRPQASRSRNLSSIVDRIRPSVETLLETGLSQDPAALVRFAVRSNIRASVDHLRHGSEILERLIAQDGLLVVGAEYSLETGLVEFFDGLPKMLE